MAETSSAKAGGIGFCGMLTILFIGLKLTGNIAWSWWWVLSPLWLPAVIVIGVVLFVLALASIATAGKKAGGM